MGQKMAKPRQFGIFPIRQMTLAFGFLPIGTHFLQRFPNECFRLPRKMAPRLAIWCTNYFYTCCKGNYSEGGSFSIVPEHQT